MKQLNKKGQLSSNITGLIFGVAALVIAAIIAFVIISTMADAELIDQTERVTTTVLNENGGFLNTTGYRLTNFNSNNDDYTITAISNWTSGQTLLSGNYSLSTIGILTNKSTVTYNNISINYTYETLTSSELSQEFLAGNFSSGINNVSSKIPTVLLVAAIVLILSILAVLVVVWQRMRMGGTMSI